MISIFKKNNNEIEFRGLSTDEKPQLINESEVKNGTVFIEIDTGKIYFYDLTNKTWTTGY